MEMNPTDKIKIAVMAGGTWAILLPYHIEEQLKAIRLHLRKSMESTVEMMIQEFINKHADCIEGLEIVQ